jgi:hypothetical protein
VTMRYHHMMTTHLQKRRLLHISECPVGGPLPTAHQ